MAHLVLCDSVSDDELDDGTNDDFKALVKAADQRGIKIIIDLVLNHVSISHPWFVDALTGPEANQGK